MAGHLATHEFPALGMAFGFAVAAATSAKLDLRVNGVVVGPAAGRGSRVATREAWDATAADNLGVSDMADAQRGCLHEYEVNVVLGREAPAPARALLQLPTYTTFVQCVEIPHED